MTFKTLIPAAVMLAAFAGVASADTFSSTYSAGVSTLSPDDTGWLTGGQVQVNGVGTGSVTLSRTTAEMSIVGQAYSGLNFVPEANSSIESAFSFDRDIDTSGALVGIGSVVAMGESIGATGMIGAADASAQAAGTSGTSAAGSASADSASQASLVGSVSTTNTMQLVGTSQTFAGANGLSIGEASRALSYGSASIIAGNDIDLTTAAMVDNPLLSGTGDGSLFYTDSTLTNNSIDLSASNAGGGSMLISASTGGFFSGGGAAAGASDLSDVGGFWAAP
jgi:hypothetical protein